MGGPSAAFGLLERPMTHQPNRVHRDRSMGALGFVLLLLGGIATVVGIAVGMLAVSLSSLEGIRPIPPTPAQIAEQNVRVFNRFLVIGSVIFGGMLAAITGVVLMGQDRSAGRYERVGK